MAFSGVGWRGGDWIVEEGLVEIELKYGEAPSKAVSWMDSRCKSTEYIGQGQN